MCIRMLVLLIDLFLTVVYNKFARRHLGGGAGYLAVWVCKNGGVAPLLLHDLCYLSLPTESESAQCFSQCGVYTENGPPVPVLSGAGLYVQDDDHNEIFYMMVSYKISWPIWVFVMLLIYPHMRYNFAHLECSHWSGYSNWWFCRCSPWCNLSCFGHYKKFSG